MARPHRSLPAVVIVAVAALLAAAAGSPAAGPRCPGSTLACTLVDPRGIGVLQPGPPEALRDRTDLAPAGRVVRTIATFAQISDAHITDEESPLRVEVIDPLGGRVSSAFRPQESLTTQVLAAAEVSVNALRPAFVLETGDLIDNAQSNELTWALQVLHGGHVHPDSGAPGYAGVQSAAAADPLLYRPDVDAPRHPGLLAAAQQAFVAPGLHAPWLPLVSNHELLVQGVVPADARLRQIAVGGSKLTDPSAAALALARGGSLDRGALTDLLDSDRAGSMIAVPRDPARRLLAPGEAVRRIAAAAGVARRAGLLPSGLLAYTRSVAPGVVLIALDTADRSGGATGVIPPRERAWLAQQLRRHAGAHLLIASPTPLEDTRGGAAALALLDRTPGVVAVLAGDTHRSLITAHRAARGGYWLVRTPSLDDYPQQARAFRLVALADGRVALETWMLDQAGDDSQPGYLGLAGISRDLAFLDFQGGRPRALAGRVSDRNERLFLPG
jgi:hypothetical protein